MFDQYVHNSTPAECYRFMWFQEFGVSLLLINWSTGGKKKMPWILGKVEELFDSRHSHISLAHIWLRFLPEGRAENTSFFRKEKMEGCNLSDPEYQAWLWIRCPVTEDEELLIVSEAGTFILPARTQSISANLKSLIKSTLYDINKIDYLFMACT